MAIPPYLALESNKGARKMNAWDVLINSRLPG